jgi:glutathione S-transferase
MPDIKLYGVAVSAFVAKVRIVLDMKGLAYEELTPADGYGSPTYRTIVPAGSVPGVVIDGKPVSDSNAIIELLEALAPAPRLMPEDPFQAAKVRSLLGFHDTRVEAAARTLFPVIKSDWRANSGPVDAGIAGIEAALERLDTMVAPSPFILGSTPCLADLAYPVTLQMAEMMANEMEREITVPDRINTWRIETAKLDSVARSLIIARNAMESWMASFRV